MAVYYKFKSAKDFESVPIDGHFISVGHLKEKIFELKHLGRGTDFDLVVTNAQTNEEYLDEGMLVPKNTSVLISRVPGRPRKPIIAAPDTELEQVNAENGIDDVQTSRNNFVGTEPSSAKFAEDLEWDEFGNDLYSFPENAPVQSTVPVHDAPPVSQEDEESKIKALIDTPALDWQRQPSDGFAPGRGFGRGMGGRMMGGRGFGRGGFEKKTPPPGYVCHRCKVPGHFIQHCPTNGDPNFDVKRVKPPTGIPKSMLMATPDGSYALPSGAVAVMKPNEAAFEKEIEGMPSTRSLGDFPPELHCPLCKEVMKDAVLTSKCCFTSFCDKCIRDHIISKSMCACGATNVLADDLLPNKTLRDTIRRILESNNSSAEKSGSAFQVQDMESRNPQAKAPSPMHSAISKEKLVPTPEKEETSKAAETMEENRLAPLEHGKGSIPQVPDVSEATHDSRVVKEALSQGSAPLPDEEVRQRNVGEAGKKKKKKKTVIPPGAAEMQWRPAPDLAPDYMMPMGPSAFNPYMGSLLSGLAGPMPPYPGPMPYMGYGPSPMDIPFGGVFPHDPFAGPGSMLPYGPPPGHRDLAEIAMGFNAGPPIMSREEFEARKADLKRKREMERQGGRELPKNREYGRESSSTVHASSARSKPQVQKHIPPPSTSDHQHPRHKSERRSPDNGPRDLELPQPSSKRKSDYDKHHKEETRSREYTDSDYDHRARKKPNIRHRSDRDDDYDRSYREEQNQRQSEGHHQHRREYVDSDFDHSQREEEHSHRHHRSRGGSHQLRSESPVEPSDEPMSTVDKKHKSSVFSRISFPEKDSSSASAPKKRKLTSPSVESQDDPSTHRFNGYDKERKMVSRSRKTDAAGIGGTSVDYESSDDDERHFKRRPSKYTSSPPRAASVEEGPRHSEGPREREREREYRGGGYAKHR